MRRFFCWLLACLATVALLTGVLLTCIRFVAFDGAFYRSEMIEKLGVPQRIGMSVADTEAVIDRIISYCKGDAAELNLQATVQGRLQPFFNEREIAHMVDVQRLFELSRWAMWGGYGAFALLMGLALLVGPRKARLLRGLQGMAAGIAVFLLAGGAVAVFAALDFDRMWNAFHRVFFTNDLWLLDYRTDRLINMMPLEFFGDTVTRIGILFGSALLVLFAGLLVGLRACARHRDRAEAFAQRGEARRSRMKAHAGEASDLRRAPAAQDHFDFEESVRELGLGDADDEDAVRLLYGDSAGRGVSAPDALPGMADGVTASMGVGVAYAPAPAPAAFAARSDSAPQGAYAPEITFASEQTGPLADSVATRMALEARDSQTAPGFVAAPFQAAGYASAPIPEPLTSAPPVLPAATRPYGAPVEPMGSVGDEYRASAYAPIAPALQPEPPQPPAEPARPLDLLSDADIDAMVRRWRAGAQGLRKDLVGSQGSPILRPVELPDWLSEYPPDARTIDALSDPPRDPEGKR